jgi:hypothetical protein
MPKPRRCERGGEPPHGGWCRSCETSPAEFVQPRVRTPHEGDLRRPLRRPYVAASAFPQPVLPQTPPVAHQHPPPNGTINGGRPHGSRRPQAPSLASPNLLSVSTQNALTGELARRARDAETSRALKGRLLPGLAKALTVSRTRGAFHPRDQQLLSGAANKMPSQPWSPTAGQTFSTPLLPVTTTTLTRSLTPPAQPPRGEAVE